MADYREIEYHAIGGNCELGCALIGAVTAYYFSTEISDVITENIQSSGLLNLVNKEPALTKIAVGAAGLLAGYYSGKVLSGIAIYFKKRENRKNAQKETDASTEWLEQIKKNTRK